MKNLRISKKTIIALLTGMSISSGIGIVKSRIDFENAKKVEYTKEILQEENMDNINTKVYTLPQIKDNIATKTPIEVKDYEIKKVLKTITNVNIRENNNTECNILGVIPSNESINVIEHIDGWYKINYKDITGYVSEDFVKECTIIDGKIKEIVYLPQNTNLYKNTNGQVKKELNSLEVAEVYDTIDDYYLVYTDNKIGYIKKSDVCELKGTFVIIDISSQILKIYQDKKQVLETPVVTGKNSTPSDIGLFEIFSKEKDRYLNGPGYSTHVNYFMPYNGGEGLHDATWRSEFGGDIYKYSGSHGCINMPLDKAAEAYEYLSVNDKVLVKK